MFTITIDPNQLNAELGKFSEKVFKKAVVHSTNRAMSSGITFIKKAIADDMSVKQSDVAKRIRFDKATSSKATAIISIKNKGIPLILLSPQVIPVNSARGRRLGITAKIAGQRQFIPGAFKATVSGGYVGIFVRRSSSRTDIEQVYTKPINELFLSGDRLDGAKQIIQTAFAKSFEADIKYYGAQVKSK